MTSRTTSVTEGLLLPGLDGSNPLGFLAAIGSLRTLTEAWPERHARMRWQKHGGTWRPTLLTAPAASETEVASALYRNMHAIDVLFPDNLIADSENAGPKNKKGEPKWRGRLRFPPTVYRRFCEAAVRDASLDDRAIADYAFDFTAGNQALIGMMRDVMQDVEEADIWDALFRAWTYERKGTSLRWDPLDEQRQYALQAFDPQDSSKNPIRAVPGANRLAICALPLFPVLAVAARAAQSGFVRIDGRRTWTWPIWSIPVPLDVVPTLLALKEVASDRPNQRILSAIGIAEVFRCHIVQPSGRYRCFTPAKAV